jgi:hypothetical protein
MIVQMLFSQGEILDRHRSPAGFKFHEFVNPDPTHPRIHPIVH